MPETEGGGGGGGEGVAVGKREGTNKKGAHKKPIRS